MAETPDGKTARECRHDYGLHEVCQRCGRTEADIENSCHHCNEYPGRRCAWCLREKPFAPDLSALRIDELRAVLGELHRLVWGECPALLNEDSCGNAELDIRIHRALGDQPPSPAPDLSALWALVDQWRRRAGFDDEENDHDVASATRIHAAQLEILLPPRAEGQQ